MIYKLIHSTDEKIVGVFPPIGDYIGYHDYSSPHSYTKVRWGKVEESLISVPEFNFEKKGKPTNIVRGLGVAFLYIDDYALSHILKFKVDDFQIFNTKIYKNNNAISYNLLYFYLDRSAEYIDWQKTTFIHFRRLGNEILATLRYPDFTSYEAARTKMFREHSFREEIKVEKLYFKESAIPFDLFRISAASPGYYCSETLKNALTNARITGIDFVPVEAVNRFTLG